VRFWVHSGHLRVEGEKMAKSAGNFFLLRDLLEKGFEPLAIRYLLVSVPYRKQFNLTFDGLHQARQSLERIREFRFRLSTTRLATVASAVVAEALAASKQQFEEALDDDLNTAVALAAVFNLIKAVNTALDKGDVRSEDREAIEEWFGLIDRRLGIIPKPEEQSLVGDVGSSDGEEIERLIAARNEARSRRDFGRADEIRQQLLDMGVLIEDTREGTRWRYQ